MKTCYYKFFCHDDLGECYGFFTENKKKLTCIHWFDANDASYRHEYMAGLFKHFGVQMVKLPGQFDKAATKLILEKIYLRYAKICES